MSDQAKPSSTLPNDPQMPGSSGKSLVLPFHTDPSFYASKADETLLRLAKLIKTTAGLNSLFGTFAYSLYIVAHLQANSPTRAQILAKISHFLGRPVKLPASVAKAANAATPAVSPLGPLIAVINDCRATIRLTGLIPLYVLLRSLLKNKNPKDAVLHKLAIVQALGYIGFQVFDNFFILGAKSVLSPQFIEKRGGMMGILKWSCRAWLLALTCEFARLFREARLAKEYGSEKPMSEAEKKEAEKKWWGSFYTAAAWFPMAIHYSVEGGIGLNQGLLGMSGGLAYLGGLLNAWNATKD